MAAGPQPAEPEVKPAVVRHWFGGRATGFVCCLEVREAVTLHVRLDGDSKDGFFDRSVSAYQPFTLTTASGVVSTLDPRVSEGIDRTDLAPLLRLTRQRAYEPEWFDDGHASIRLEDGTLLTYPAHPTETSWMLGGRYGETRHSLPGGRVVFNKDFPTSWLT